MAGKSSPHVVCAESLCHSCQHGRTIVNRATPEPATVEMAMRDNPGFVPPKDIVFHRGFCTHPDIVGSATNTARRWFGARTTTIVQRGPAQDMGTITACDLYQQKVL